ncbi:hypothetical protein XHC_1544 [Xanthomonas hortorum pv. carotae str. M081]|nr:hypothetical protein XHC_1544 [Xanthomonas hortorum pv. carotae str. M081]
MQAAQRYRSSNVRMRLRAHMSLISIGNALKCAGGALAQAARPVLLDAQRVARCDCQRSLLGR